VRRSVTGTTCRILFISLLGLFSAGNLAGFSSTAQAQEETQSAGKKVPQGKSFKCSNATLEGRYAVKGEGLVPGGPPPAPLVPFAVVSLMTFDGAGNLTDAATASNNGVISSNLNHGTYTVNEDCSGTLTVTIPFPPFQLTHNLVIADKGNEFYLIVTTPSAVTLAGKRVQ
jgi:hypothetical protein